jgi:hypothetical protein
MCRKQKVPFMNLFRSAGVAGIALAVATVSAMAAAMPLGDDAVAKYSRDALFGSGRASDAAFLQPSE